jgi:ethanolamine utilization protein EutA
MRGAASPGARVFLVAFDFGTTTSSAVVASARLARGRAEGRVEIADVREVLSSPLVFTPFRDGAIDGAAVEAYVGAWLAEAGVRPEAIFGGGAILTGLAAERRNAAEIARAVGAWLRDAVVATAGDPCLESWLAFMSGAAALSRARPDAPVLHLDVGGGTTNLALGLGGRVTRVGSLFVGARHVEVVPGTYRVARLSAQAEVLFDEIGIRKGPGDTLSEAEVDAVIGFYDAILEAAVSGREEPFQGRAGRAHVQVQLRLPEGTRPALITVSGGVGELFARARRGDPMPSRTAYGDLGIDLALRLRRARWLTGRVAEAAHTSRATAYGLLLHNTRVSGSTIFLPRPEILPLAGLPVFDRLPVAAPDDRIAAAIDLVRRSPAGGCVAALAEGERAPAVLGLGKRMGAFLQAAPIPPDRPLVVLVEENLAKAFGGYVTAWGRLPSSVVVLDEVPVADARFVQIGRMVEGVVPVSFYGMSPVEALP